MKKLALTALAICAPLSSFAAVLWDNPLLGVGNGGYWADAVQQNNVSFYAQSVAGDFTLGAASNVSSISWVGASEFFQFADLTNMPSFEINIYDASFNNVFSTTVATSSLGQTILGPSFNGANEYELTYTGSVNLGAGSYWLNVGAVMTDPSADAFAWSFGGSATGDLAGDFGTNGTGWTPFSGLQEVAFRLEGSAVPEPATMAVLGLGVAALARRRRSSK
jgi:hypothetical protein